MKRGSYRRILCLVLAVILLVFQVTEILPVAEVYADTPSVLIVGDSRVVGMMNDGDFDGTGYYVVGLGGSSISALTDDGKIKPGCDSSNNKSNIPGFETLNKNQTYDLVSKCKGVKTVVIMMGRNGMAGCGGGSSVEAGASSINTAVANAESVYSKGQKWASVYGAKVLYAECIKDKSTHSGCNACINAFNNKLKQKAGSVIEIANCVTDSASDPLHPSPYVGAIDKIKSAVNGVSSKDGTDNSAQFRSALKDYLGHDPSDQEVYDYSYIISTMKADGMPTNAIAGMLGNMACEGDNYAIEGYSGISADDGKNYTQFEAGKTYKYSKHGNVYKGYICGVGHGRVQWSFDRAEALDKVCDEGSGFSYVTITHWRYYKDGGVVKWDEDHTCRIPDIAGQGYYMVKELNGDYKSVKDKICKDGVSARDAAIIIVKEYEVCAGYDTSAVQNKRADAAEKAVPLVEAHSGTVGGNQQDINNAGNLLYMDGVWDEDQLSAYCRLHEIDLTDILDDATIEKLNNKELQSLDGWKKAIEKAPWYIRLGRIAVMGVGIFCVVWGILLYCAYWFDKINTFIDLDVVGLLTFRKLKVAFDDSECTFKLSDISKTESRTINHKYVLIISITAIFFGVFLISGLAFTLLRKLVNVVTGVGGR